jgi:hypothetical protein
MSSYFCEMIPQVWWIVDVAFSHTLDDYPQTQVQEKCLYLKAHAFNAVSSALSSKVKDTIEMKYGFLEGANLHWMALEQIYGWSKNEISLLKNDFEMISYSTISFDQDQEEQVEIQ